jgi:hypothetical protein
MNLGLAVSADSTRLPGERATSQQRKPSDRARLPLLQGEATSVPLQDSLSAPVQFLWGRYRTKILRSTRLGQHSDRIRSDHSDSNLHFEMVLNCFRGASKESQRIGRLVRDARNQSRDWNLTRHHASVQFIHPAPPAVYRVTRAIWTTSIQHSPLLESQRRRSRAIWRRRRTLLDGRFKPCQLFRILKP